MKWSLTIIVLIVATSLPAFSRSAGMSKKTDQDEQEVRAVIRTLADAGMRRDVAVLDRLYSDDYFHTNPDGSIMTKEQVLASYKAPPKAVFESNKHDEERVQVRGDIAVVSGTVTLKGRIDNQPFVRSWRVTYVLRKGRGRWQIIVSHASIIT